MRTTYIVQAKGAPHRVEGAAEAVRCATGDVYLDPIRRQEHIERLEQSGRTAWAYGFGTAVITVENHAPEHRDDRPGDEAECWPDNHGPLSNLPHDA